ncbi:molecular chaperone DnaJ [Clostridium sardiniense]|uniref:molecular chaperone DnaJ n=1 Tax=Clostridium sardiniense TaxID=29369 RepID=UPI00195E0646|nr:molecular chaperone DnaJ [Clostridium sardiniense]MBM7834992.1 hypothetical protein [Clostridium sardiniense]
MFCSVKRGKDKYGKTYKFYLCNRYRDKETGKVKSSDKYIMTLQEEDINIIKQEVIYKTINNTLEDKDIGNEEIVNLIYNKYLNIKIDLLEKEHQENRTAYEEFQEAYEDYKKYYGSYSSSYSSGMSSVNFDDTTKDVAKEFIKLGFRAMAKKYHPDIAKDSEEKMKVINSIKEKLEEIL